MLLCHTYLYNIFELRLCRESHVLLAMSECYDFYFVFTSNQVQRHFRLILKSSHRNLKQKLLSCRSQMLTILLINMFYTKMTSLASVDNWAGTRKYIFTAFKNYANGRRYEDIDGMAALVVILWYPSRRNLNTTSYIAILDHGSKNSHSAIRCTSRWSEIRKLYAARQNRDVMRRIALPIPAFRKLFRKS